MTRRRRILAGGLVGLALSLLPAAAWYRDGRCGDRVASARMTNHTSDFDFGSPPCVAAEEPAGAGLRIAYLGVGGVQIEWRGATLVTAPYFSHQRPHEVLFANLRADLAAISGGVTGFRPETWDTILSGHSHYDHLADVPEIMLHHAKTAQLWTNDSGVRMFEAHRMLGSRVHSVEPQLGTWIRPTDRDGTPLPYRFAALASDHAPHLYGFRFAHGEVSEAWDSWRRRPVRSMRDGLTVAYVIDLLDESGETALRIHYQDSAAPGVLAGRLDDRDADVAILCIPAYWNVEGYPEELLETSGARFVLAIHYEDFLRPHTQPLRFVPSLTDARVDEFLDRVEGATSDRPGIEPVAPLCGPSGEHWAMPLPREWIGFDTLEDAVLTSNR